MPAPLDLTGERFGRLLALTFSHSLRRQRHWFCECDCGATTTIAAADLKSGNTRSCGCLRSEGASVRNSKHGLSHLPEYAVWKAMRHRCSNPDAPSYDRYGGRGISVCKRWEESFEAFLADVGTRPFPKAQLDRENNNGNYEPNNCRWVTAKVNIANRGY